MCVRVYMGEFSHHLEKVHLRYVLATALLPLPGSASSAGSFVLRSAVKGNFTLLMGNERQPAGQW